MPLLPYQQKLIASYDRIAPLYHKRNGGLYKGRHFWQDEFDKLLELAKANGIKRCNLL